MAEKCRELALKLAETELRLSSDVCWWISYVSTALKLLREDIEEEKGLPEEKRRNIVYALDRSAHYLDEAYRNCDKRITDLVRIEEEIKRVCRS